MEEYKLIDWRLYDPSGFNLFGSKNDKASLTTVTCSNSKNCDAYKLGKCAVWHGLGGTQCPYGKKRREYGFTKRARKFYSWISERRERVKGIPQLGEMRMFAVIGDYIFVPYPHWTLDRNISGVKKASLFQSGQKFIPKSQFTPEFFQKMVLARPQALMGGEITSYQKDVVPKMVMHLEEVMIDLFNTWKSTYPKTWERFETKDYVGRKALVNTLPVGSTIPHKKGTMVWNGKEIVIENYKTSFCPVDGTSLLIVTPDPGATVVITDNSQVSDTTKFVE